jgi:hypothetical protein
MFDLCCIECYKRKGEKVRAEFIVNGKSYCQWHSKIESDYKEVKNKDKKIDSNNWFKMLFVNKDKRPQHLTDEEVKRKLSQALDDESQSRGTLPKGYGRSSSYNRAAENYEKFKEDNNITGYLPSANMKYNDPTLPGYDPSKPVGFVTQDKPTWKAVKGDPTLPANSIYKSGTAKSNNSVGADTIPSELPKNYFRNKKLPFEVDERDERYQ